MANLYIYGEVGYDVTVESISTQLSKITDNEITVKVSGPGGNVFQGLGIYDILKTSGKEITTIAEGLAASASSIIHLAAPKERRFATKNARIMIHNPWGGVSGDADKVEKYAEELRKIEDSLITLYAGETGIDAGTIAELLKKETYMNAEEALAMGFISAIHEPIQAFAKYIPMEDNKKSLLDKVKNLFGTTETKTEVETVENNPGEDTGNDTVLDEVNNVLWDVAQRQKEFTDKVDSLADKFEAISNRIESLETAEKPETPDIEKMFTAFKSEIKSLYEAPASKEINNGLEGMSRDDWAAKNGYVLGEKLQEKLNK